MLYREIIAVCSQIHTKHINTAVWAERRIVNVKLVVHIVTAGLYGFQNRSPCEMTKFSASTNVMKVTSIKKTTFVRVQRSSSALSRSAV